MTTMFVSLPNIIKFIMFNQKGVYVNLQTSTILPINCFVKYFKIDLKVYQCVTDEENPFRY